MLKDKSDCILGIASRVILLISAFSSFLSASHNEDANLSFQVQSHHNMLSRRSQPVPINFSSDRISRQDRDWISTSPLSAATGSLQERSFKAEESSIQSRSFHNQNFKFSADSEYEEWLGIEKFSNENIDPNFGYKSYKALIPDIYVSPAPPLQSLKSDHVLDLYKIQNQKEQIYFNAESAVPSSFFWSQGSSRYNFGYSSQLDIFKTKNRVRIHPFIHGFSFP